MSMRTLSGWMAAASLCAGCGEAVPPVDPSLDPAVRAVLEQARADVVNHVGAAASWGRYGIAFDAHGCRAEAAACYRRARTLAPAEVAWAYLLAGCVERENPQAAIDLYRQAVEADGRASEPRFRLAELLLARDEPRAALEAVGFSPAEPIHEAHRPLTPRTHRSHRRIARCCSDCRWRTRGRRAPSPTASRLCRPT